MKTKNSFKKYDLRKIGLCLIACLFFLTILGGCGSTTNETTVSGTASQTDLSRKSIKPENSPIPEDKDTDISMENKKRGKISLSKDKKTIFVDGWLETHELTNRKTTKATKIVFRKDAGILVDGDILAFCLPPLQYAPLVKEIEVEEGNPYLYVKDGMLIQRAGADFDFQYTTDRETLILCVPCKKGEIQIPEGVQDIYSSAFRGCSDITSVFLPSSLVDVGTAAFGDMKSCKNIHPPKNSKEYISINGVLYYYSNSNSVLIAYPAGKTDKIFNNAPKNTDFISAGAFLGATHLQEVYLPSGMEKIDDGAFGGCKNLRKVIVKYKKKINEVSAQAFFGCPKLKERVKDKYER